jgi:hypothetical protein
MNRPTRDVLAFLSLACCVLSLALWLGARGRPPRTIRLNSAPAKAHFLVCGNGGLYFLTQEVSQATDGSWTARITDYGKVDVRFSSSVAGATVYPGGFGIGLAQRNQFQFRLYAGNGANATCAITFRAIGLPFWALAGLTAAPPATWLFARHRRRRLDARRGVCRQCGYDLRATPGRCPECGLAA